MKQNIRATGNLDKYEFRGSRYGALDLFQRQTRAGNGILTQEMIDKFWGSIGHTFQVPVYDAQNVTISVGQARSLTVADSENDTNMVVITPVTYSFGFTMYPTLYHNNEFGYQQDFQKKLIKYLNQFGATLDSACITALSAAKTQVIANPLDLTFSAGNILTATADQRAHILGALDPIMQSNDYYDQLYIVGDLGLYDHINRLKQLGVYNAANKQLEYAGKILGFSNRITAGEGNAFRGFVVNDGSVGILYRVDREALYGTKSRTGREWSVETLPMLDIPVGHMYYEEDVDASTIAGAASADMTASHKQCFGFSVDIALVTPYNSKPTTNAAPIVEFTAAAGNPTVNVLTV